MHIQFIMIHHYESTSDLVVGIIIAIVIHELLA